MKTAIILITILSLLCFCTSAFCQKTSTAASAKSQAANNTSTAKPAVSYDVGKEIQISSLTASTTFEQAIDILRNSTTPPTQIVVMWRQLENAGIETSTHIGVDGITKTTIGAALRTILNSVSSDSQVTYWVQDKMIIIGTPASKASTMTTKIIDISDLAGRPSTGSVTFGGAGNFAGGGVLGTAGNLGLAGNTALTGNTAAQASNAATLGFNSAKSSASASKPAQSTAPKYAGMIGGIGGGGYGGGGYGGGGYGGGGYGGYGGMMGGYGGGGMGYGMGGYGMGGMGMMGGYGMGMGGMGMGMGGMGMGMGMGTGMTAYTPQELQAWQTNLKGLIQTTIEPGTWNP